MSQLRFDGEFCGDYADDHDHDDIDPTGGCGWDSIDAGGGYDADSEADWNDERQPDEAQEWHDFDPDC